MIGEPVNEAARLCEHAKSVPGHLVASSDTLANAGETESAHWTLGEQVSLRGLPELRADVKRLKKLFAEKGE